MRIFLILLISLLSGCSKPAEKPRPKQLDEPTQFQSEKFKISDTESVTVYDVPGKYGPTRCWVYVNETTKTTHQHCDRDAGGDPINPND